MNLKETLKKIHKKFPTMTLDELFDIVDCYVEEFKIDYSQSPIISNPYKYYTTDPFPKDWTTCDYPKDSVADQIANKLNGGITYANSHCSSGTSDRWIEGEH